jgi:hypothetical protein
MAVTAITDEPCGLKIQDGIYSPSRQVIEYSLERIHNPVMPRTTD